MTDFFIKQTSFDYDMEFQDVKKIAEQFPNDYDNFYKFPIPYYKKEIEFILNSM